MATPRGGGPPRDRGGGRARGGGFNSSPANVRPQSASATSPPFPSGVFSSTQAPRSSSISSPAPTLFRPSIFAQTPSSILPGTTPATQNSNTASLNFGAASPVSAAYNNAAASATAPQQKRSHEEGEASTRAVRRKFTDVPQMTAQPIKVQVGESQTTFFIHKDLLVKHSEFYKAALNEIWKEGTECTVKLPNDDPEHFKIFAAFLYTGHVHTSTEGEVKSAEPDRVFPVDTEWIRICQSWALGQKLLSVSFKDACTDAFVAKMHESQRYPSDLHTTIYAHGPAQCGMKRLCVDVAVWKWSDTAMNGGIMNGGYVEFWYSVAAALHKSKFSGLQGTSPFAVQNTCGYHDHGKDSPCYKTMF